MMGVSLCDGGEVEIPIPVVIAPGTPPSEIHRSDTYLMGDIRKFNGWGDIENRSISMVPRWSVRKATSSPRGETAGARLRKEPSFLWNVRGRVMSSGVSRLAISGQYSFLKAFCHPRHNDIKDNEVGRNLVDFLKGLPTVTCKDNVVAVIR
jgi:hypothetical protein